MRSRTELIFQVVREKRIGMLYQGSAGMARVMPRCGWSERRALLPSPQGEARRKVSPATSGIS
jgi:hypothetical protein